MFFGSLDAELLVFFGMLVGCEWSGFSDLCLGGSGFMMEWLPQGGWPGFLGWCCGVCVMLENSTVCLFCSQ
jgi:hypothetical protein